MRNRLTALALLSIGVPGVLLLVDADRAYVFDAAHAAKRADEVLDASKAQHVRAVEIHARAHDLHERASDAYWQAVCRRLRST